MLEHSSLLVLNRKFHCKVPVGIAGRNLMAGACIDQRKCKSDSITLLGRSGVGLDSYSYRPLYHVGVVSATPEMLASTTDRTIHRDRPIDFRHMAALANEAPLLHEELAFVLGVSPTRSHVIILGRS